MRGGLCMHRTPAIIASHHSSHLSHHLHCPALPPPPPYIRPVLPSGARLHACSRLLSSRMADELHAMIPETARLAPPTLLFATYRCTVLH
jgi:hypothetical protein